MRTKYYVIYFMKNGDVCEFQDTAWTKNLYLANAYASHLKKNTLETYDIVISEFVDRESMGSFLWSIVSNLTYDEDYYIEEYELMLVRPNGILKDKRIAFTTKGLSNDNWTALSEANSPEFVSINLHHYARILLLCSGWFRERGMFQSMAELASRLLTYAKTFTLVSVFYELFFDAKNASLEDGPFSRMLETFQDDNNLLILEYIRIDDLLYGVFDELSLEAELTSMQWVEGGDL